MMDQESPTKGVLCYSNAQVFRWVNAPASRTRFLIRLIGQWEDEAMPSITKKITGQDPTPVYFKLQIQLLKEIENGRWAPGQSIPPERILAETHKISIGTVKKAILNLVNEGYLYRIQGKGTFVAGNTLDPERLRYYRFLESFEDEEIELQIKLLNLIVTKSSEPISSWLKLKPNQNLYEIKRAFLGVEKPIVYCISYLPQKMFPDLTKFPKQKYLQRITQCASIWGQSKMVSYQARYIFVCRIR